MEIIWGGFGLVKKTSKMMIAGAGMAAASAAVGAAAYMTTKILVQVALDREQPKIKNVERARNQIRGNSGNREFFDYMAMCGNKLEHLPHKVITIQSYDGQKLVGHWFRQENARRVIVAMHGWRSSWCSDFGMISQFWHKENCSVLYAEQRGQGSSGGDHMGFGLMERYDCLEWIKWVNQQYPEDMPVYLAGVSMGAATVLMTADLKLPANVRGIMADCAFTSPYEIWKHVAQRNLHLPYSIHGGVAEKLCRGKINMGPKDCSTLHSLKNSKVPIWLAHGSDDHFVPVEMTYQNYQACTAPKQLLIVPGADHGMSYYLEKSRYEQEMLKFWNRYDKNSG